MKNIMFAGLLTCLSIAGPGQAQQRVAYGSTAASSVHYTYAVAAAAAINKYAGEDLDVTVLATGGAVENLDRIRRGQIHIGLGSYPSIYQAYQGLGTFEGQANPDLRGLYIHAPSLQAWVVREDSGIKTLGDLDGNPFTPGQRGSATEALVIQMLEVLGIQPDYQRMALADAVDAVKNQRSIGYVKAGGVKTLDGTTLELKTLTPITLLGFDPDQVAKVREALPYIAFRDFAENEIEDYPALTMPVQVVGEFTTKGALTNDQVKALLSAIIEGQSEQSDAFPAFASIDIPRDSVNLINIPLHAGAVEFYRDKGIDVPDALIPPEMK